MLTELFGRLVKGIQNKTAGASNLSGSTKSSVPSRDEGGKESSLKACVTQEGFWETVALSCILSHKSEVALEDLMDKGDGLCKGPEI